MAGKHDNSGFDLASIGAKLQGNAGQRFWRGLEELGASSGYRDSVEHEFPRDPGKEAGAVSRRDVLRWMGASAAFAGLTACTKLPTERIGP